jgi:tetratricopeptide (TPR) repeat protein
LPPARQLIRQVQDICKNQENTDWPLSLLAEAQAYAGDHAAAVRTAKAIPAPLWRYVAVVVCWQIHFQRTGAVGKLFGDPGDLELDKALDEAGRAYLAEIIAKAGQLAEAKKLLPTARQTTIPILMKFYLSVGEHQAKGGKRQEGVASLKQAWTLCQKFEGPPARIMWLEEMVKLAVQLAEPAQALRFKNAALDLVQDKSRERSAGQLALDWARMGKLHGHLKERDLAREAFRKALSFSETGFSEPQEYVAWLGRFAAWQYAAGLKSEAAEGFAKALARSKDIDRDGQRNHYLLTLLEAQGDAGDVDGAMKVVHHMRGNNGAYYQALGYCACAGKLVAHGQPRAAQELLTKAEALADAPEHEARNSTHVFTKIAELKAKAGDLPGAKRCLRKALAVSAAGKKNDHHQAIARSQVRIGLLEDAYQTIQLIPEMRWRLLPLAELAREAAKRESLPRKKGTGK